jgi:RNA polymerase sigma-70 factor (ECF subfamily)
VVEERLLAYWPALCAAWPGVSLDYGLFVDYVAERLRRGDDVDSGLRNLSLAELYLACACGRADPLALEFFEARYLPGVGAALSRLRLGAAAVDELKQRLRRSLFVAEDGRRARIALYSGRGALAAWLRVTVVRSAFKETQRQPTELPLVEERLTPPDADAELRHLKRHYRPLFRDAFTEALSSLDRRDRRLLHQYYVDGLTIEQMGAAHGAHRMTVGRWLDAVRQRLLDQTRRGLMRRVRVSQAECDSIIRMVHSRLDLTFRSLVRSAD